MRFKVSILSDMGVSLAQAVVSAYDEVGEKRLYPARNIRASIVAAETLASRDTLRVDCLSTGVHTTLYNRGLASADNYEHVVAFYGV